MNKILTIAAIVLLLIGAVAIAVINNKNSQDPASEEDGGGTASVAQPSGPSGTTGAGTTGKSATRTPREIRDAELTDRYGSSKTKLSRTVSTNVISLLDDVIEMGETMSNGAMRNNFGGGRWATRAALRGMEIELTEEQQDKLAELYGAFQKRELEKAKDAVNSLKKDPSALMELFLAGDARKREEITQEEFESVVASSADDLTNIVNPLDRNNFRGGRPMEDETFQNDFIAILDEDQAATVKGTIAEREAEKAANPEEENKGNITNIPTMELETLDQAVIGAQKMTSGFKQVMEGMGSLQELRPQIEPEGEAE